MSWLADLLDLPPEQSQFIDETMFTDSIAWRLYAYALMIIPTPLISTPTLAPSSFKIKPTVKHAYLKLSKGDGEQQQ